MENKNINLLWSGGHASALCLTKLIKDGYRINALISIVSKELNEIPFHGIPDVLIKSQARALTIPNLRFYAEDINHPISESSKQTLKNLCQKGLNKFVISNPNGIFMTKIIDVLKNMNAEIECPLEGLSQAEIFKLFIESGNKAIITSIDENYIPLRTLGRELNREILEEMLTYPKDSFHTFTTFTPNFKARLTYSKGITTTQENFTVIRLREV